MGGERRIVVTGLGALTPVGNDAMSTWNGIAGGRSGIQRITAFDPAELETQIAGEVKDFDPKGPPLTDYVEYKEARRLDRFAQFAVVSTGEAIADACLTIDESNGDRIGALIGTAIGGILTMYSEFERWKKKGPRWVSPFFLPMVIPDTAAGQVAISFGVTGPNMSVASACATGTNAIGEAAQIIRRGDADVMICGGTEAALIPMGIAGFNVMRALSTRNDEPERASRPFDATRDGFVMGEGCAILILETLEGAQARGARIYGEVLGYGSTADANHLAAPVEGGKGMAKAMAMALKSANLTPEDVDYINAHGTGTELNDKTETAAVKRVFGEHAYDLAVSSTKSMVGHTLGAAGAIEAMITLKALQNGLLPPTINYEHPDPECDLDYVPNEARRYDVEIAMSNSMGLGGHNASIIFGKI